MTHFWWLAPSIGFIAVSMLFSRYVERRLEERNIGNKITGLVCAMLWGALALGLFLAKNVMGG